MDPGGIIAAGVHSDSDVIDTPSKTCVYQLVAGNVDWICIAETSGAARRSEGVNNVL